MKKLLIAAFALALPTLASAQSLISGYNFGQFLGDGGPALNAITFDPAGSIGSNFRLATFAPSSSSGNNVTGAGDYSNGFGRIYWNGTNGSTLSDYAGAATNLFVSNVGANSVNSATVQNYASNFALQGDEVGLALTVSANTISFVQNTAGYVDFTPTASVKNLSFAASSAGGATINWSLLGSGFTATTTVASGGNFALYSVDLPAEFYGVTAAQLSAAFTGTATIDNVQFNATAIPEPGTYAAILGALTLGVVAIRRRKVVVA
jgi:hypothetical protein